MLLEPLKQPLHANLPMTRERYNTFVSNQASTDIPGLIRETIETAEHLGVLRREIKEIESGINS